MKNIHVLSTPNPSRLIKQNNNKLILSKQIVYSHISKHLENINQNIYITSDEEIKIGDWVIYTKGITHCQKMNYKEDLGNIKEYNGLKIILTTDQDLIKDGVQVIDDEFLEWFVKNPNCEEVEITKVADLDLYYKNGIGGQKYKIIIPKEETFNSKRGLKEVQLKDPNNCAYYEEIGCLKDVCDCYTLVSKQETLEEFIESYVNRIDRSEDGLVEQCLRDAAKWQQEQDKNKYSEEDVREAFKQGQDNMEYSEMYGFDSKLTEQEWFEQFKKK